MLAWRLVLRVENQEIWSVYLCLLCNITGWGVIYSAHDMASQCDSTICRRLILWKHVLTSF